MKFMKQHSRRLILFDIDHTLFDATRYRNEMFAALAEKSGYRDKKAFINAADEIYFTLRQHMLFDPDIFIKQIRAKLGLQIKPEILEEIIVSKQLLRAYLYEEVEKVLQTLSREKDLGMGIFSGGRIDLQKSKIQKISHLLHDDHVHIFMEEKENNLPQILEKYKGTKVYLVDDVPAVLYTAKRLSPDIVTILIQRDQTPRQSIPHVTPDHVIRDLTEILPIIQG